MRNASHAAASANNGNGCGPAATASRVCSAQLTYRDGARSSARDAWRARRSSSARTDAPAPTRGAPRSTGPRDRERRGPRFVAAPRGRPARRRRGRRPRRWPSGSIVLRARPTAAPAPSARRRATRATAGCLATLKAASWSAAVAARPARDNSTLEIARQRRTASSGGSSIDAMTAAGACADAGSTFTATMIATRSGVAFSVRR